MTNNSLLLSATTSFSSSSCIATFLTQTIIMMPRMISSTRMRHIIMIGGAWINRRTFLFSWSVGMSMVNWAWLRSARCWCWSACSSRCFWRVDNRAVNIVCLSWCSFACFRCAIGVTRSTGYTISLSHHGTKHCMVVWMAWNRLDLLFHILQVQICALIQNSMLNIPTRPQITSIQKLCCLLCWTSLSSTM